MARRILWAATVVAAVCTSWVALRRPPGGRLTDLGVYTGAVSDLRQGASLYDFSSHLNAPFTYPPFAGLLFLPLADVPALPLQIAWTLATLAAVVVLAWLVGRGGWRTPALALVLVLSAPVASNIKFGQVSLFLAVLVAVDLLVLRRYRAFGVLIGLAAAIKLTPLIFIPLLWLAGRRRAAVVATATFAGGVLIAALILPGDSWRYWATEMTRVNRLGPIANPGNQSLNGVLLRAGVEDGTLALVLGGIVAAVALGQAARLARRDDWLAAMVVTGAAGIVLSPVSWTHHQIWLVLGAAVLCRDVVLVVMLLPLPALGGFFFGNIRFLLAVAIAVAVPAALLRESAPDRQISRAR